MPLKDFREFLEYKKIFEIFFDPNKFFLPLNLASKLAAFHFLLSCMPEMRPGED